MLPCKISNDRIFTRWHNPAGPLTARASRHVPYVPQWLIRPCTGPRHLLCYSKVHDDIGVNPGGWGSRSLRFWAGGCGGSRGGARGTEGSWTGRKILLYVIMYRKYVRKW